MRIRYFLLFLAEIFYRCLLGPFDPLSINFIISLFSFGLDALSIGESAMLKPLTINVWGSKCELSFSNISFTNVGAFAFGV